MCNDADQVSRQLARMSSRDLLAIDSPAEGARAQVGGEIRAQVDKAMKGLRGKSAKSTRARKKQPRPRGCALMQGYRTKSGGFATQWDQDFGVVVHAPVVWPSATKSSPSDPYLDGCGACHHTHSMLSDTARQRIFGFSSPHARACCGSLHLPLACACDLAVGTLLYGITAFWFCADPPAGCCAPHKYWRLGTDAEREEWDAEREQRVMRKRLRVAQRMRPSFSVTLLSQDRNIGKGATSSNGPSRAVLAQPCSVEGGGGAEAGGKNGREGELELEAVV